MSVSSNVSAHEAESLLRQIDRVAHWLPGRERLRSDLLAGVADLEQKLAARTLSPRHILTFQVNVWRLQNSRFRTLLLRRVAELDACCHRSLDAHTPAERAPLFTH